MKIHTSLLAPLVALSFFGIILIGSTWELPSMQKQFTESTGQVQTVNVIVKGLQCRGTSDFFMRLMGDVPGIVSISTFVQEHRATIKYDPSKIDPESIKSFVERPVKLADGRVVIPFKVLEIRD